VVLKLLELFIYMECPVCYEKCHNTCNLVCRHSFCMSCVREWWSRSDSPSCPICRKSMYFRGMRSVVVEWEKNDGRLWEELCTTLLRIRDAFKFPYVLLIPLFQDGDGVPPVWELSCPYCIVPRHQFRRIMPWHNKECCKL